ncbi:MULTISPECIES: YtxH domain-containing protein [Roseivirga]|jgi:gas vesicle protein|uniref:Gas vesicle protein n=1 Tax=Roseivirga spongicola TaxID=333140 RepID=A0A150XEZ2_9BACT|nr:MULTISPECIES: YtxH domain-containing protein [Roseivirga]PWL30270.1 MAG: YtxH domain-containing protein [Roseivirga sp. XM-24bin3]KYG77287.1 gas vesicle protein [Roseivirga spongicola]MBO6497264.1 YtxH domain-containing protein [Roseivirga sp.]MBO6662626.1 YtxH domain-containing protein [Roseivirga sp.]MBO6760852.1 YtxH domain-containing protein [Roseivirga sp.]|tara:strand:- start:300 stop:605 length:306 start_codon:yes stop_codon:yes gene_type:complete
MNRGSSNLLAFVLGAATGAVIGILYAPDKGSNTRDKLSYQLDKYKKQLEDLLEDLVNGKIEVSSMAKEESQKVVTDARKKAEQLLTDVDDLIGQIKSGEKA